MKPEFERLLPADTARVPATVRLPQTLLEEVKIIAAFDPDLSSVNDLLLEGALRVIQDRIDSGLADEMLVLVNQMLSLGREPETPVTTD